MKTARLQMQNCDDIDGKLVVTHNFRMSALPNGEDGENDKEVGSD